MEIPDPGNLVELESTIADLESRAIVDYVVRARLHVAKALPPVVAAEVSSRPLGTREPLDVWRFVASHIAVKGHGAWNAVAAQQTQGALVVDDFFGQGLPDTNYFDYTNIPGLGFALKNEDLPAKCAVPPAQQTDEECAKLQGDREHGYYILGIAAATHSPFNATNSLADIVTGINPGGLEVAFNDLYRRDSVQANRLLLDTLRQAAANRSGTIVVNRSHAWDCVEDRSFVEQCNDIDTLRNYAFAWIDDVRRSGLENRGSVCERCQQPH